MGATIDYAILYTKNYQESHKTMLNHDAIAETVTKSSMSITVSMSILVSACLSCYFLSSDPIIKEITMLIARGSFISYFVVLIFLPAIWAIGKNKIAKPAKIRKRRGKHCADNCENVNIENITDENIEIVVKPLDLESNSNDEKKS